MGLNCLVITNTFLQKILPSINHSFQTLKDWNKFDNETKESSTTLEFKNRDWASYGLIPLTQQHLPSRHTSRSLTHIDKETNINYFMFV